MYLTSYAITCHIHLLHKIKKYFVNIYNKEKNISWFFSYPPWQIFLANLVWTILKSFFIVIIINDYKIQIWWQDEIIMTEDIQSTFPVYFSYRYCKFFKVSILNAGKCNYAEWFLGRKNVLAIWAAASGLMRKKITTWQGISRCTFWNILDKHLANLKIRHWFNSQQTWYFKMAGKCGHDHQHKTKPDELGNLYTLFLKIDLGKVQCLNECSDGSAKNVFKPWDERLDIEKV